MKRLIGFAGVALIGLGTLVFAAPGCRAGAEPQVSMKEGDLDLLFGPIALYPDTLLAQILMAAGDPAQVTKLSKWLPVNKLTGTALQDAATVDGFDPQFVALTLFPTVVTYMAQNIDWTTKVGKAFGTNKAACFDSIQRLRGKAQKAGALKDSPQQNVETKKTSSGQEVIVIEPANPQVIYVPQYNPTVVYTQPATTTVVVEKDDHTDAAVAGLIGFTAGIALGAAMDNDYYYGPYGWHGGAYMYNDAWDDYYDAREDAREDWQDHREDLVEERGDRRENTQEQRTDRQENRQENRPESSAQRTEQRQERQSANPQAASQARATAAQNRTGTQSATQSTTRSSTAGSREARGYNTDGASTAARSGTKSDAFSGYSSGKSERAASSRGAQSRSSSRGGGGGGGRRR